MTAVVATSGDLETRALVACLEALEPLDRDARERVLDYVRGKCVFAEGHVAMLNVLAKDLLLAVTALRAIRETLLRQSGRGPAKMADIRSAMAVWIESVSS